MAMNLLLKASEEKEYFKELIGTYVTFKNDIINISGHVTHEKGEKAYISDVMYIAGHWSGICTDIYIEPKISMFQINNTYGHWNPQTFIEF